MSMVKYVLTLCLITWFALIALMPKVAIYYKLEEQLHTQDIVLNEASVEEGLFTLELKNVSVYVKGIPIASIEEVTIFTLLLYSSIEVKGVEIDDSLKHMVPKETEEALFRHSLLDPFSLSVEALGSFGAMQGSIDLKERNVYLDFNESKHIQMLQPKLQKSEKGWIYETSF